VSTGTDKVSSGVTYTLSANVENLTLTGAAAIIGTGNAQANSITGNVGSNQLNGGAGSDRYFRWSRRYQYINRWSQCKHFSFYYDQSH